MRVGPSRVAWAGVVLHLSLGVLACGAGATADEDTADNVLWITVDTLRADRLSSYGHRRSTSPAIDALAAAGTRFERAYSTAPWTTPSVASMLTGRIPSSHGVFRTRRALPPGADSFPRRLRIKGFQAWAIVSNRLIGRANGFDEHFDRFDESYARGEGELSTTDVVARAEVWLERLARNGERFLLFVHLFDPHAEYLRHPEIGFAPARGGVLTGEESFRVLRKHVERLGPVEREFLGALYDEEVRFTDDGIGRLVARLAELGLDDSTLVVVTADHGEELLERGWLGHTRTLFDELVRVPLVVAGPGVVRGAVVDEPVSLVELPAALSELLGVAPEAAATRLAARLRGEPGGMARPVVFEVDFVDERNREQEAHLSAIVVGEWKLVRDEASGALALYDLARDPLERRDLAERRPEIAEELRTALDAGLATERNAPWPIHERELDDAELDELHGLGYVGGEDD